MFFFPISIIYYDYKYIVQINSMCKIKKKVLKKKLKFFSFDLLFTLFCKQIEIAQKTIKSKM